MSVTDKFRRLLDERGVKWTSGDTKVSRNKYTHFCPDAGMSMGVWESGDGKLGIDAHTDYRFTPEQAIAATLGRGTCREVYLLMATDIGDGREEVLGVYATEEAAIAAINENQFGYALHHVRKWEVDE